MEEKQSRRSPRWKEPLVEEYPPPSPPPSLSAEAAECRRRPPTSVTTSTAAGTSSASFGQTSPASPNYQNWDHQQNGGRQTTERRRHSSSRNGRNVAAENGINGTNLRGQSRAWDDEPLHYYNGKNGTTAYWDDFERRKDYGGFPWTNGEPFFSEEFYRAFPHLRPTNGGSSSGIGTSSGSSSRRGFPPPRTLLTEDPQA